MKMHCAFVLIAILALTCSAQDPSSDLDILINEANVYMNAFDTLVNETNTHIANNFANLLNSFAFYKKQTFETYFNTLRTLKESAAKVNNDANTNSYCFMNLFSEVHVSAAADATQCVAVAHNSAHHDIPTYMNFLGPFQTKTLKLSLTMLDDLIEKNPVTDALELANEIWPTTYDITQDAFRENYFYQANDFYRGINQMLGRLYTPLFRCLEEVEANFENTLENLRTTCRS